jgi:hypothetical protein
MGDTGRLSGGREPCVDLDQTSLAPKQLVGHARNTPKLPSSRGKAAWTSRFSALRYGVGGVMPHKAVRLAREARPAPGVVRCTSAAAPSSRKVRTVARHGPPVSGAHGAVGAGCFRELRTWPARCIEAMRMSAPPRSLMVGHVAVRTPLPASRVAGARAKLRSDRHAHSAGARVPSSIVCTKRPKAIACAWRCSRRGCWSRCCATAPSPRA